MDGVLLFARLKNLERSWPFLPERLVSRLEAIGETRVVDVEQDMAVSTATDLSDVTAIALFGGHLSESCIDAAPVLKAAGSVLDRGGHRLFPVDAMFERNIALIDATRAWGQSVAECSIALALNALRRIPQWDRRIISGETPKFEYGQFSDAPDFVNGTLGTKTVGVIGLGNIGGLVAKWCHALGARVLGYDPFISKAHLDALGTEGVEMDQMIDEAEVVFITVPPTPSAKGLLSRERIKRLKKGTLVVVTTRAHAVDMEALRERILADELAGAFDVLDKEPIAVDDPLRRRDNVVYTPHIAGRTRDANLLAADILADDFERVLKGETPQHRLSREALAVRDVRVDLPEMEHAL